MFVSMDGKIDGAFMGHPAAVPARTEYGNLRSFYRCDATLYGAVTMAGGFADGWEPHIPHSPTRYPKEDWLAPNEVKNYILSVDPKGELAGQGVRELILVAQETTLYGVDLYGKKCLPELLTRLCEIRELEWIRILYCYPEEVTEDLIAVIKKEEKICHYLDIPVQSGSDTVLRRMGRKTDSAQIRALVRHLREEIPDICLRTTLISGFPGETEEEHEQTLDFVDEMEFDRLGVFAYSEEEDTPAAEMSGQILEEVKERRRDEIMELQQEIAFESAQAMVGRTVKAMIEGKVADENAYVARTYKDAPSVDGYLFINSKRELMSGDFVNVKITGSNEYDLIGEMEDER